MHAKIIHLQAGMEYEKVSAIS